MRNSTFPVPSDADPSISVNDLLRLHPTALPVLNAFGIDTCCGGAASLREACVEAGVDLARVLEALRAPTDGGR